jgi:hypothetical protein
MALVFQLKAIDTEKDFDVIFPVFDYSVFFTALGITDEYVKINNVDEFTELVKNADLTQINSNYTSYTVFFENLASQSAARKFDFYINFILDCLHYNYNIILVNCNSNETTNTNRINKTFNENNVKFFVYDPLKDALDGSVKNFFEEKRIPIIFNTKANITGSPVFPETRYINTNTTNIDFNFNQCSLRTHITGNDFTYLCFSIAGVKRLKRYYNLDDVDFDYEFAGSPYILIPLISDAAGALSRSYNQFPWVSPAGFIRGEILNQSFGSITLFFPYSISETIIPDTPEDLSGSDTSELGIAYAARINTFLKVKGTASTDRYYLLSDFSGVTSNALPVKTSISYCGLLTYINTEVKKVLNRSLFELNDSFLRTSIKDQIESFLNYIRVNQGIDEFRIVCDDSNNSPENIQNRKLTVDIYIKPAQSINFVELSFTT